MDGINADISKINQGIDLVRKAWKDLQDAVAANPSGTPSSQFNQSEIDAAIATAGGQVAKTGEALKGPQSQATNFDQQAAQLDQDAKAYVATLQCK